MINSEFMESFGNFFGRLCIGDQGIDLSQGCDVTE